MSMESQSHIVKSVEAVVTKRCGCVIDHGTLAHSHPTWYENIFGTAFGHKPKIVKRCDGTDCALDEHPDEDSATQYEDVSAKS